MPRPFYVIAHKVNQIEDIAHALSRGANAIECDIRHSARRGYFVSHWAPDFDPVDLGDYLDAVVSQAQQNNRLALVIFDCKPAVAERPELAVPLLLKIRNRLTRRVPVSVLLSTASYSERSFLGELAGRLRAREGVAIDEEDDVNRVTRYFQAMGIQRHAYGNGVASPGIDAHVPNSILNGIALKAGARGPRFVYVWTLNSKDAIRNYMRMGVDGVFVNHRGLLSRGMSTIFDVLNEPEFRRRLRLAVRGHDPFAVSHDAPYLLTVETDAQSHAGTDADLTFRLTGADGSLSTTISAKPPGLFEARDRNVVTLEGSDIGPLKLLTVSRNTAGGAPGWYLKAITVSSSRLPRSHRFAFDTWIPRRGATRWVGQASYRFAIKTSDVAFAGTDATVRFLLEGVDGYLTHEIDGNVSGRFERDRLNQFTVNGPDVGMLRRLTVSHDESGSADDWHLEWAQVQGPDGTQRFDFDRWISGRPVTIRVR